MSLDCGTDDGVVDVEIVDREGKTHSLPLDIFTIYYDWIEYRDSNGLTGNQKTYLEGAVAFVKSLGFPPLSGRAASRLLNRIIKTVEEMSKKDYPSPKQRASTDSGLAGGASEPSTD